MYSMGNLASLTFSTLPLAVSAQVLSGSVNVGGVEVNQQRLTLSCPFFDMQTGWASEKSTYTIHIVDTRKAPGNLPASTHGIYSHIAKKWRPFEKPIEENRIVFGISDVDEKKEYVVNGRTHGGQMVSKGEDAAREERVCTRMTQYLDRNTLELKFELDEPISPSSVDGGILTKCVGADAFPRGQTLVKAQCAIIPYLPAPNRIGF